MKISKKITLLAVAFVAIVALLIFGPALANDSEQVRRDTFYVGDHICVAYDSVDGSSVALECFCPCEKQIEYIERTVIEEVPGDCPEQEPCEECEPVVIVEYIQGPCDEPGCPTPEPTEKPKCNAGRGNGSEGDPDCDPGNSGGHNQGGD